MVLLPVLQAPGVTAEARLRALGRTAPRFSDLALLSVGLLILTGIINLALHTLDPPVLVANPYGQTLILKHLLFLPLPALGLAQNRRVTPCQCP